MSVNPLLIDVPDQIETDRLVLRVPQPEDRDAIYSAAIKSHTELRPWMPWAHEEPTPDSQMEFISRSRANFHLRSVLGYVIRLRNTDDSGIAGLCGIHHIEWNVPKFEFGYWIRTDFTGKGFATESVNALTRLAFDQFKAMRVELRIDELNLASCRVADRCGFALEGTLHNDFRYPDGRLRNTRIYSKVGAA